MHVHANPSSGASECPGERYRFLGPAPDVILQICVGFLTGSRRMLRLPRGGPYFELLSFRSPSIFNVQSCNLLFSRCVHIIAYVFSSFILADPRIPWSASLNSLLSHSPSDGHHHPLSPIGCCHDCSHMSLWMEQRVSPRLIPRSGDRGTISTYLHT